MFYYCPNMWNQVSSKNKVGILTEVLTKNQALLFSSQIKYFDIS